MVSDYEIKLMNLGHNPETDYASIIEVIFHLDP